MTEVNVGYIIVGLVFMSQKRCYKIAEKLSYLVREGVNVFYSGDHFEMITTDALTAELYKASGFEIKSVLI